MLEHTKETMQFSGYVVKGNLDGVAAMVLDGFDINAEIREHRAALHLAVASLKVADCERLIDLGADVNLQFPTEVGRGYSAFSPLHLATQRPNLEICRMLLAQGANPNSRSLYNVTPLHVLLEGIVDHENWVPTARLLLEHGTDPNAVATKVLRLQRQLDFEKVFGDRNATTVLTPLHCALFESKTIEENIKVAAKRGGFTGAHMIEALLEHGAEPSFMPDSPPKHYLTPLQLSTKIGSAEDVQKLIGSDKADPAQKTVIGRSLRQLTGRPEIQIILRAEKTSRTILDSIEIEAPKGVRRSTGMSAL